MQPGRRLYARLGVLLGLLMALLHVIAGGIKDPAVFDGKQWVSVVRDGTELRPPPILTDSWKQPDTTLFVGIAAYRDKRCGKTLYNFYTKAKYPDRISIGLVQQIAADDLDCIANYCELMGAKDRKDCPHIDNIRQIVVSNLEAKGPTFGRHLQSLLLEQGDEEFCMQTDSHMDVEPGWDKILFDMWGMLDNEYAVLSTYVHDFATLGQNINNRWEVPHLCQIIWTGSGMVRNEQAKAAINLDRPIFAPLWAAGLSFSKCHAERKTPYDPKLPQIFDGEEFSKFARLWTRGYDTYSPHRSIVVHDYHHREGPGPNPLGWTRNAGEFQRSTTRLKTLLGLPNGERTAAGVAALERYGLGTKRTLDQLIDFTGIDLRNAQVFGNRCNKLPFVPFTPDPHPKTELNDPWGGAPAVLKQGWPYVPLSDYTIAPRDAQRNVAEQAQKGPDTADRETIMRDWVSHHRWSVEGMLVLLPILALIVLCASGALNLSGNSVEIKKREDSSGLSHKSPAPVVPVIFQNLHGMTKSYAKGATRKQA